MSAAERSKIRSCIERHLSDINPQLAKDDERCERYVSDLIYSANHWEEQFNVTRYSAELEEIERCLSRTTQLMSSLDDTFYYHANMRAFQKPSGQYASFNLSEFGLSVREALRHLKSLRKEPDFIVQASRKRNWSAASVARECKLIWGAERVIKEHGELTYDFIPHEESFQTGANDWGRYLKITEHLMSLSPNSQHHLRPGPFGRFVEDIFDAMLIQDKDGGAVTAATALDSLGSIKLQENVII